MAFTPKLDICNDGCSELRFVDVTGLYSSTSNPKGWGNGVLSSALTAATILVTDEDGETVFTYDVLSQIPNPVVGDIIFTNYEYALPDGQFTVTYTLTFGATIYTSTKTFLNTCTFECCIHQLIATIPAKICSDKCNTDYIDEVLLIEGLYYGYMCAAECEKTSIKDEIEKRLTRFCDFNCNCS